MTSPMVVTNRAEYSTEQYIAMNKSILMMLGCLLAVATLSAQGRRTALKCGRLLDVRSGQVLTAQVVVIKDNRIEKIVPASGFQERVDSTIDLSGYFVMPGMIDCHTHVLLQGDITGDDYAVQLLKESNPYRAICATRSARKALMNGFTSIRDLETEGAGYVDVDVKKAVNKGIIPGPRMFVATRSINTFGHYPLSPNTFNWELDLPKGVQEVNGADETRRAVRDQLAHGADWIKIYADRGYQRQADGSYRSYPNFTSEELSALADETARSGRKWAAHAVTPDGILPSVRAGASTIEHGFGMNEECMKLMVEKGVFWCPTIYVCDYVAEGRAKEGSPINKYFMESLPTVFKKAMDAGVKIAYGTDIGGYSWDEPEARDFEYMVRYGMSSLQAIRTATLTAAQLLDMEGRLGELKAGALADVIALKGDPISDVKVLQQVQWVMKDGVVEKSAR